MHPSRIFLYFCLSFLGGIAFCSLITIPHVFAWGFSILGLSSISMLWKKNDKMVVIGFCLLIFAIGIYRYQMFEQPKNTLDYYAISPSSQNLPALKNEQGRNKNYPLFKVYLFKEKLSESLDRSLSPPHSSLAGAIMLGQTDRLSQDLKQKLNISGTRHITSISGMNVVILANMIIGLGLLLGMWRGQAFYFAVAAIILYILMAGAPASAVRAGIMGGVVLFAEKTGRLSQAQRLLIIAATIMLAMNPLLLKFDIGFQLSFMATLGLIKLSPYLREKLTFIPKFFEIRNTVSMTISAVIFTAPILAYNFSQFSLVSIFTNILIVPVLSLILGLGFIAGILGIIFPTLGQIAFWPAWLILEYVYKVISFSALMPFASLSIETFPWYLSALYFLLLLWSVKYFKLER